MASAHYADVAEDHASEYSRFDATQAPPPTRRAAIILMATVATVLACSANARSVSLSLLSSSASIPVRTRTGRSICNPDDGYRLVWSDEFDGTELDRKSWEAIEGWTEATDSMTRSALGSAEDVWVADGSLVMRTRRNDAVEDGAEGRYTTGAVRTLGKREFAPGRVCVSARLPGSRSAGRDANQGLWPAHWLSAELWHSSQLHRARGCQTLLPCRPF